MHHVAGDSSGAMSQAQTIPPFEQVVYEFRPLPTIKPLLRYAGGEWIPDDGEYDLAFITNNFCFYIDLPYQKNILWSWCKDGDWRAYVKAHPRGNAWHYMLREGTKEWAGDWGRHRHPNTRAGDSGMSKACNMYGCSNGRGVHFHIGDETIAAGLVRERDSKKILTFPDKFICMYGCECTEATTRSNAESPSGTAT